MSTSLMLASTVTCSHRLSSSMTPSRYSKSALLSMRIFCEISMHLKCCVSRAISYMSAEIQQSLSSMVSSINGELRLVHAINVCTPVQK